MESNNIPHCYISPVDTIWEMETINIPHCDNLRNGIQYITLQTVKIREIESNNIPHCYNFRNGIQ